jgi:hypothetical protein
MAKAPGGSDPPGPDSGSNQHPYVERLRPDPASPPPQTLMIAGLPGNSDRPGFERLYFTRELNYYAEFRTDDVLFREVIASDTPPFVGLDVTRIALRRDATVSFTHERQHVPVDQFDLEVRLGQVGIGAPSAAPIRTGLTCFPDGGGCTDVTCGPTECVHTCVGTCGATCRTCQTQCMTRCNQNTCQPTCANTCANTCATCAGQATCGTCAGQATCATCAGQATCATCAGQATCATCLTHCGTCVATCRTCDTCRTQCDTCDTCNPHVFTCGPNPQCRQ